MVIYICIWRHTSCTCHERPHGFCDNISKDIVQSKSIFILTLPAIKDHLSICDHTFLVEEVVLNRRYYCIQIHKPILIILSFCTYTLNKGYCTDKVHMYSRILYRQGVHALKDHTMYVDSPV